MKNWFMAQIDSTKIWWSNNYQQIDVKVKRWAKKLDSGFEKFAKIVSRLIIIGVILNIVASYFYPEFQLSTAGLMVGFSLENLLLRLHLMGFMHYLLAIGASFGRSTI